MGTWEANVYINDHLEISIKIKNSYSLNEIRDIIGIDNSYIFRNKNNAIIINEQNYVANDIWKNDKKGGYRIDLIKENYKEGDCLKNNKNIYQVEPIIPIQIKKNDNNTNILKIEDNKKNKEELMDDIKIVNLYLNDFKTSAIAYKPNMSLDKIKELGGDSINKDSIFFLTKDNTIIKKIDNFRSKDCLLVEKNEEMKINLVTKEYYKKIEIIDHLEKLAAFAGPIDWLKQEGFFIKIRDFAGLQIANAIIDDIYSKVGTDEKMNDKQYVRDFLKLLIQEK